MTIARGSARGSAVRWVGVALTAVLIAGCASCAAEPDPAAETSGFPSARFADLTADPLPEALATALQPVLDEATGAVRSPGLTAALMTPDGSWTGATGTADGTREMTPEDQMAIGSVTKTIVAAQVLQLVDAGELGLGDPAGDHLPAELGFDTNGATVRDLLEMRSGIPDYVGQLWESLSTDPQRTWTPEEALVLVGPERSPAGAAPAYSSTNYLLLGLVVEELTGRPIAEVLRTGVLDGDDLPRLVYQPAESPTEPMALPGGDPASTLEQGGGYLPSLAGATAAGPAGAMAADAATLARWWSRLCGGHLLSQESLDAMTDSKEPHGYGLGIADLSAVHGSGAVGHGGLHVGFTSHAACVPDAGVVVVVLANAEAGDLASVAETLVRAATSP